MIKFLKHPLIILLICFAVYYAYSRMNYYFIIGSSEVGGVASVAIAKNDPSICDKIRKGFDLGPGPTQEELKNHCYFETAKGLKDEKICENVSGPTKENCYLDMAYVLEDESICKFTYSEYEGMCYGNIARQKKDGKICENASNESSRNRCYSDLNQMIGDISICENKIHITQDKDNCYFAVVLSFFQRDMTLTPAEKLICEKIMTQNIKDDCIRYYNDSTKR